MNFKEILELIDKVADKGIGSLEVEQAGVKIRIEGKSVQPTYIPAYVPSAQQEIPMMPALPQLNAAPHAAQAAPAAAVEAVDPTLIDIPSPMVGTFYRSASPEAAPFVTEGTKVRKGQTICIIEAMKLMNELESDVDGTIVLIYPQNAQPVEYGEKLFAVRPL